MDVAPLVDGDRCPVRYVSIIQSSIESGAKMIHFNIQFKTKFELFIQSKIHSKICPKYSIQNFIPKVGKKWFKCQKRQETAFSTKLISTAAVLIPI